MSWVSLGRYAARGVAALLVLGLLAWVVFGSPTLLGAVIGALSVAAVAFILAELAEWWPVRRR